MTTAVVAMIEIAKVTDSCKILRLLNVAIAPFDFCLANGDQRYDKT